MKVLVTGASGFIGRFAIEALRERGGVEIVAASRTPPPGAGFAHERVDLLAPGEAVALARRARASHLLHLAWNARAGFWSAPDNLDWTGASLALLRAFTEAGGERAVLAGTCAEYAWDRARLVEDGPLAPGTLYGVAKDSLRRIAEAYARESGLALAWGRVFWLYGPGERPGRLVSDIADAIVAGRPAEIGEGRQARDFLHVADVARAFVAALDSDHRGAFNIGSGTATPVRDMAQLVAQTFGRPDLLRVGARPSPPGEPPSLAADVTSLSAMGFAPRYTLAAGVAATAAGWRAVRLLEQAPAKQPLDPEP